MQDKLQKYVVPFYAVCDGGWMSGGYPSSTDRSGHKFFTKYYHSPLDSANNRCYITTRTKEGDKKKAKAKGFMNSLPPEFQETR